MLVRKKKNPGGVISVQVISKSNGKYKMLKVSVAVLILMRQSSFAGKVRNGLEVMEDS
jgi:hypothetical protein